MITKSKKIVCRNCKRELTRDDFYSYSNGAMVRPCKECKKKYAAYLHDLKREKRLEQMTQYSKKHDSTPEGKKRLLKNSHNMHLKYPDKWKARTRLRNAVALGKIIKPEHCQEYFYDVCKGRLEAHHYLGYQGEHWKDVMWLCVKHHKEAHRLLIT